MLIVAHSELERSAARTAWWIWARLGPRLTDFAEVGAGVAATANTSTVVASATRTPITISTP